MDNRFSDLEIIIEKINYLFKQIQGRTDDNNQIEISLLKKYGTEFYEQILSVERGLVKEEYLEKVKSKVEEKPVEKPVEKAVESKEHVEKPALIPMIGENDGPEELPVGERPELSALKKDDHQEVLEEISPDAATGEVDVPEEISNQIEKEELALDEEPVIESKEEAPPVVTPSESPIQETVETPEQDATQVIEPPEEETGHTIDLTQEMNRIRAKEEQSSFLDNLRSTVPPVVPIVQMPTSNLVEEKEEVQNIVEEQDFTKTEVLERPTFDSVEPEPESHLKAVVNEEPKTSEPKELHEILADKSKEPELADKLRSNTSGDFGIGLNQRYSYIRELFGGDENIYDGTISELSKCANVIEAFTYLNLHIKNKYGWDQRNEVVQEFQNTIKAKFLS